MTKVLNDINTIIARIKPGGEENKIKYELLNDREKIKQLLSGQFKTAWNKYSKENVAIWRGTKSYRYGDIAVLTPGTRISQNVNNCYTRLMSDILPSWKDYPKRSRSFICTTSSHTATMYATGKVYLVLPENGAKIGVCPMEDIWDSFNQNLNFDLSSFASGVRQILERALDKSPTEIIDLFATGSDKDIIEAFNLATIFIRKTKVATDMVQYYRRYLRLDKNLSFLDLIENKLNPEHNNFTLTTIEEFTRSMFEVDAVEVWTDATCLMIEENLVSTIERIGNKLS